MSKPLNLLQRILRFAGTAVFLSISIAAWAQEDEPTTRRGSRIIDDTTRNIYGPNTSKYFYEEDFFNNQAKLHSIDTTPWNFDRFSYVQRYNNFYQDLGNIGTAIKPIYSPVTETIGVSSGFDIYDLYWKGETIKYYDTKSPYSNMYVILGGKGRSVTRVTFSRNINPQWNIGFNYRVLLIDKQVQREGKGDRHVRGTYYDLYSTYHTKDSAYTVFINYRRNFQQVDEYGGVLIEGEYEYKDLFEENAQPFLTEAESNERRSNFHVFHQYKVGSGLQLYHKLDLQKHRNRFNDSDPDNDYYNDVIVVDSATTRDQVELKTMRNEVGVKGNLLKLFYNGYAAFRKFTMEYKYFYEDYLDFDTDDNELYVGGRIALQIDSLIEVKGWAEWMLDDRYQIQGSIETRWFEASAKRSVSTPSFLSQAYRGSHNVWLNEFNNVEGTEVKGNLIYRSRVFSVYPGVRFTTLKNNIFFKDNNQETGQRALPMQSEGFQTWVSPELVFTVALQKHVTLTTQTLYTRILENADDAIQVPDLFINAQLVYSNIWFNGNFDFQAGVNGHWKSAYYAPSYDLVIQQFYIQQQYEAPSFPIVDLFINAKIKRARIFLKYNNVLKAFSDYGNVPTPFYPGINNLLDFGFDWSFYD